MTWIIDKVVLGKEPQLFIYYFWSKCVPLGTLSSSFKCVRGLGVGKLGVLSFPCTFSGTLVKCMPGAFNKKAPKYHLNTILSMCLSHVVKHHQRQLPGWSHSGRELEGSPSTLKTSEGETDKDFKGSFGEINHLSYWRDIWGLFAMIHVLGRRRWWKLWVCHPSAWLMW